MTVRSASEIYEVAIAHNRRYFLPRRYHEPKPWDEPTDLDREYDACRELVYSWHAIWLQAQYSPGIELTGKPIDAL